MDPVTEALPYIRSNLETYGIEWINKGRVSDNFKFLIFGRPDHGKQIGIYGREKTIIRLESYGYDIPGVSLLPKCATSHAANAKYSNFRDGEGVCVIVDNTGALKALLDQYFAK
ncbi:hypothetical protein U5801_25480 [Lamprobacter modestohalophilus]|uniref:hypothetical protein n=1 Tax=Lamprobacter modestohalophilus TaxID=1064514 RepID=UPI002ADED678|nr:hypothetical protein [Lamprobacter modestohalophilus]MEA1053133.1 hypothetical protein [Lamprobacter modestohalophilus]